MNPIRRLFLAAAAGTAAILAGCGDAGNNPTPTASTGGVDVEAVATKLQKPVRIGVSIPAADHGWTAGVVWWAKQAMELYPDVEWVFQTAESPSKQIQDIENMMTRGVDGLVILCTESAPLTPIAKQAHEKGILIVNVDRGFLEPVADIFLEGDNASFGRKSAEFMVEKLDGKGNVVILEGIPCTVNTARVDAAREVFAMHPGIEIVGQDSGMWNRATSLDVMQNILVKAPKIDAVWASDDDMALGAEQAIVEAGREKEMWILGGAGMKDIVARVMENDPMFPADITYPPSMIATGIQLAVGVLEDGKREKIMQFMPQHLMIDVELILPDNAEKYYFPKSVF